MWMFYSSKPVLFNQPPGISVCPALPPTPSSPFLHPNTCCIPGGQYTPCSFPLLPSSQLVRLTLAPFFGALFSLHTSCTLQKKGPQPTHEAWQTADESETSSFGINISRLHVNKLLPVSVSYNKLSGTEEVIYFLTHNLSELKWWKSLVIKMQQLPRLNKAKN